MKKGQEDIMGGLVALFVCLIVLTLVAGFIARIHTPEEGSHTGYIVEAGYRGLIWKTHYIKVVDSHFATYKAGVDSGWWYYGVENDILTRHKWRGI